MKCSVSNSFLFIALFVTLAINKAILVLFNAVLNWSANVSLKHGRRLCNHECRVCGWNTSVFVFYCKDAFFSFLSFCMTSMLVMYCVENILGYLDMSTFERIPLFKVGSLWSRFLHHRKDRKYITPEQIISWINLYMDTIIY